MAEKECRINLKAHYTIHAVAHDRVLLRDTGDWTIHQTVTNDVENVVKDLATKVNLKDKRIFYIDSENEFTEIIVENNEFVKFNLG